MLGSRRSPAEWPAHNASIVDTVPKLCFNSIVRIIPRVHTAGFTLSRRPTPLRLLYSILLSFSVSRATLAQGTASVAELA